MSDEVFEKIWKKQVPIIWPKAELSSVHTDQGLA